MGRIAPNSRPAKFTVPFRASPRCLAVRAGPASDQLGIPGAAKPVVQDRAVLVTGIGVPWAVRQVHIPPARVRLTQVSLDSVRRFCEGGGTREHVPPGGLAFAEGGTWMNWARLAGDPAP
jgi:hypothetical protein